MDAERAGWALQGIIRSQKHRPAAWKLDTAAPGPHRLSRRLASEQEHRVRCAATRPPMPRRMLQTKDAVFAEAVFAMNDWLLGLQYREEVEFAAQAMERRVSPIQATARPSRRRPTSVRALASESLAEACRVAKQAGDLRRYEEL